MKESKVLGVKIDLEHPLDYPRLRFLLVLSYLARTNEQWEETRKMCRKCPLRERNSWLLGHRDGCRGFQLIHQEGGSQIIQTDSMSLWQLLPKHPSIWEYSGGLSSWSRSIISGLESRGASCIKKHGGYIY